MLTDPLKHYASDAYGPDAYGPAETLRTRRKISAEMLKAALKRSDSERSSQVVLDLIEADPLLAHVVTLADGNRVVVE